MILIALKSLFFLTAILGYSTGVWRLISGYYQNEFKTYLDEEVKKNKYLLVDPVVETPPSAAAEIITDAEIRQAGRSVTANRLLDEMIVSFGRLFTTRNEAEFTRERTSEEIITATAANVRKENKPTPASAVPTATVAGNIIESDKFPRSSSSEVDNELDENDVASADDASDEEEKWIKYWKNRKGSVSEEEDSDADGGHCEAKLDACGL